MKERIKAEVNKLIAKRGCPRIGLLGCGKTNRAVLDVLTEITQDGLTVYHSEPLTLPCRVKSVIYRGGDGIDSDLLFVSPSVRRENLNLKSNVRLISDTELFFYDTPENTFLVSGSDGKSTVTAMAAALLSGEFPDIFLGGNIGTPVALCDLSSAKAFVIELSSFNLRYITPASARAVITNVTPNHLNWHESYEEYVQTKRNLLLRSREPIINVDTPECERIAQETRLFAVCSMKRSFADLRARYSAEHFLTFDGRILLDGAPVIDADGLYLRERHNTENFMSAIAMTLGYCGTDAIYGVAKGFRGLPHRCEKFLEADGIAFIDSSIDTSPERTGATLRSLCRRVSIILGGRGKGLSLSPLREPLASYAERIAVYGEMRDEIVRFLKSDRRLSHIPQESFELFDSALEYATRGLTPGSTVLLSPAATSYGEFADFEQRGERFKAYVRNKYKKYKKTKKMCNDMHAKWSLKYEKDH